MILSILAQGENYGYAIIKRVRELSADQMQWTDGMLYPVLHRLQRQGMIESFQQPSETGRKRKYYRLKDTGRQALQHQKSQWITVYETLTQLWEKQPCSSLTPPSPIAVTS